MERLHFYVILLHESNSIQVSWAAYSLIEQIGMLAVTYWIEFV